MNDTIANSATAPEITEALISEAWIRPTRILLVTDLTDLERTLPVAIGQAKSYGAEIMLAYVLPDFASPPAAPSLLVYSHPEHHREHAERILLAAAREAEAADVRCTWKMSSGDVAEQIEAIVKEWKPGRVIVGSHGETKFCLGILGSTAERLFHRLAVPVVGVGPKVRSGSGQPLKGVHMLAPTSLKRQSRAVLRFAAEFAAAHDAEMTLLHVIPHVPEEHPSAARIASFARQMLDDFVPASAGTRTPTCVVESGHAIETILKHATSGGFDLILLGSVSSSSFLRELVPGTAYGVLCGAPCPVLILKQATDALEGAGLPLQG
jgi:nucleotide-binding universal stress UspA family protein